MAQIEVLHGDITKLEVDAIVNAANESLLGGGGVDGAIHRAAGAKLLEECRKLNGCDTGDVKITKGYSLKAKFVINTVGPVWRDGNSEEDSLLKSCYQKSLQIAEDNKLKSIAFPAISTGVYGFPFDRASKIALRTVYDFITQSNYLEKVIFVLFSESDFTIFHRIKKTMK